MFCRWSEREYCFILWAVITVFSSYLAVSAVVISWSVFCVSIFTCALALCCSRLYSFKTWVTALEYEMFLYAIYLWYNSAMRGNSKESYLVFNFCTDTLLRFLSIKQEQLWSWHETQILVVHRKKNVQNHCSASQIAYMPCTRNSHGSSLKSHKPILISVTYLYDCRLGPKLTSFPFIVGVLSKECLISSGSFVLACSENTVWK